MKPAKRDAEQHQQKQPSLHIQQNLYQGPLPPPEAFEHYNHAHPGTAERILVMAEEEQRHRHQIDKSEVENKKLMLRERSRGQWMAFCIALTFASIGAWLIHSGYSLTGTILGTMGVVPVIYAFIPKKQ